MKLKDKSVKVEGMHYAMWPMLFRLDDLYRDELGYELTITSACDGRHKRASRHYAGIAVDVRTRPDNGGQLSGRERDEFADKAREVMGHNFFLYNESNHFHIALKPKNGNPWTD